MHHVATVVLDVKFHENVGIRPNIARHGSLHRDPFRRIVRRVAMMGEQRNGNRQQANNYEGSSPKHIYHCTPPYSFLYGTAFSVAPPFEGRSDSNDFRFDRPDGTLYTRNRSE